MGHNKANRLDWSDITRGVAFKNTSGEVIPPFAVMELDYSYESGKSATQLIDDVEVQFFCKKPTSSGAMDPGRIVFNLHSQIAIGGYGFLNTEMLSLAMFSDAEGDVSPGVNVGAKASSWYLSTDGRGFAFVTNDSGKANWVSSSIRSIFVRPSANSFRRIEGIVTAATTVSDTGSPYDGMRKLTVDVQSPSCNDQSLWDTSQDIYEHVPLCLTGDEEDAALVDRKCWGFEGFHQDMSSGASPGDLTPCHFVLDGICCPE